jgi:2-amino-4-hydroxy-6-hydroxymethyldihydropteridine diphosphokinase
MGTLAFLGVGSNLGDRKARLDAAVAALAELPGVEVRAVSSYHETAPVGGPGGQGAFLNAAAAIETTLDPLDLLHGLQRIEAESGRVRLARWGERTLDLDLLLFGDRVIETVPVVNRVFGGQSVELQVPHPRMAVRRFVLAPLAEIAPGAVDPLTGRAIADLLVNLDRRPSYVAIHGVSWESGEPPLMRRLYQTLVETLPARGFTYEKLRTKYREHLKGRVDRSRTAFDRLCLDLNRERWSSDAAGGSWVVSDVWFDAAYHGLKHVYSVNPVDNPQGEFLHQFLDARSKVIAPTFVVAPHSSRQIFSRAGGHWPPPLGDVPILEINPDDRPEAIAAEVLAACAATRAG